ncbi:MAG: outer membrane protein transport protein [Porphyromonadaceae bacterium]|nr:outer membrane protein transport protein [Porphyromonadaceae bacterium]
MEKKIKIVALLLLVVACITDLRAQSAVEALQLTDNDLVGSARFVSMGGAFTSLGGDISSLSQNPAGIGVYSSNEVVTTLTLAPQSTQVNNLPGNSASNKTRVHFDNLGFVGTFQFKDLPLENINIGAAYNSRKSFSRNYHVNYASLNGSLSNAIAGLCTENPNDLLVANDAYNNGAQWLDILAYDNFLTKYSNGGYEGLYTNGSTSGNAYLDVRESGYNNEYTFNFGGNIANRVFFGIGVGIIDLHYDMEAEYGESLTGTQGELESGTSLYPIIQSDYSLYNNLTFDGTGANFKAGLIVYLTDFWRIGAAIHTPTYYSIRRVAYGDILNDYVYTQSGSKSDYSYSSTPVSRAHFSLRTPLKFMVGTSYTIGYKAIVSADYEFTAYSSMNLRDVDGYEQTYAEDNDDISTYLKNNHTVRVGAEYRITSNWSARLGYSFASSPVSKEWLDNDEYVPTAGTVTNYALGRTKNIYSGGLGYHIRHIFVDLAYQHSRVSQEVMAYSAIPEQKIPGSESARLITKNNNIILTFGVKF